MPLNLITVQKISSDSQRQVTFAKLQTLYEISHLENTDHEKT